MKLLLLISLVPLVLGSDGYFSCNSTGLTTSPDIEFQAKLNNEDVGIFSLAVHKTIPLTFKSNESISVTLRSYNPEITIDHFILVARDSCETCDTLHPVGRWDVSPANNFAEAGQCNGAGEKSMVYEANTDIGGSAAVNLIWQAPDFATRVQFVAMVIATDGRLYEHIHSDLVVAYELTQAGREESVHYDPREFEEPEDERDEMEEEFYPGAEETEGEEEEGLFEDPDEGERIEKELEEESLRRDMQGDNQDDHGARAEEQMKREEEMRRQQEIQKENEESEGAWMQETLREVEEKEEEFQNELMEYEKAVAEEAQKRLEMIQWEIHDKEVHDRLMHEVKDNWEKEDREKNKTPKKEYKEPNEIEIEAEEEKVIKASSAGMVTASFAIVTIVGVLNFFF